MTTAARRALFIEVKRMLKRILLMVVFAVVPLASATAAWGMPMLADETTQPGFKPELIPDVQELGERQNIFAALWVIAIFVIMLIILYPTAWKKVLAGLKAREERIRRDIADAEATRLKAEPTLRQYNQQLATAEQKVRDLLTQAGVDAERIATNIRIKAQQEAEEAKEAVAREIEAAKQSALTEIYEKTADLATAVAEKIIRRNLNANDQRDLVAKSLQEMQPARRN
jgi:F-type H+-transporting ATPase subunit b